MYTRAFFVVVGALCTFPNTEYKAADGKISLLNNVLLQTQHEKKRKISFSYSFGSVFCFRFFFFFIFVHQRQFSTHFIRFCSYSTHIVCHSGKIVQAQRLNSAPFYFSMIFFFVALFINDKRKRVF